MASNFKHLELLPLDEENLIVNDNPESNLKSKACLNLGFVGLNTISRFINILKINKLSAPNNNTFLDLTYILEGVLINTLTINSISNPSNTELTAHYKKRHLNINSNKILPSFSYCQNLTFTGFKPWGGFYGTLNYYNNLLEDYEEYQTPSQIINLATQQLFKYSASVSYNAFLNKGDINYQLLSNFYTEAQNLLNNDSIESDKNIYNLSINILLTCPLIKEIYNELTFYQQWLPKIYEWYTKLNRKNIILQIVDNPATNEERANNTLLRIINILNEEGFITSDNLSMSATFIGQAHTPNLSRVINKISLERVNVTYVKLDNNVKTQGELFVIEFIDNISKFRQEYDFNKACNIIQETFAPPGGYALFLVTLASTLLNRAYILSYQNINNNSELLVDNTYKRIVKLIGYACILLIKSNLPHAELISINILKSFKIFLTEIDPNNFLDIY